jgi:predicted phosphodiesterase
MLLLHISDIHFQAPQCLNPDMDTDRGVRTRLERHLGSQVALLGKVDAILVGGDVAFKGDPLEYGVAKKWLLKLANDSGCVSGPILVIPGNHDVDRVAISRAMSTRNAQRAIADEKPDWREGALSAQLADAETAAALLHGHAAYNVFAAPMQCQIYPGRLYWKQDLDLSPTVKLRIHGLTSTILSGRDGQDDDRPSLYVSPLQTALDPVPNVVNMVMCHHPCDWLIDGDEVEDALNRRATLQLFGHKHRQRVHRDTDFVRWGAGAVNPSRHEKQWQPASFVDAISENDPLVHTMEVTLASLDESTLLAGIEKQPSVAAEITRRRQDLFRSERFWAISGLDVDKVLASSAGDHADDIVASMMACGRVQADPALKRFGARPLIRALEKTGPELEQQKLGVWLRALSNQKNDLTQVLLSRELTFMPLLVALARATHPDAVGSDGAVDPWVEAVRRATGRVGLEDDDYLRAFLLTRALGWQSNASAALMKCSLEVVHRALADGRMPTAGWKLLYQRLPWVAPWREWDRCWRVRQVVAERFVERDLDPVEFGTVVEDSALWRDLAVTVTDLWRGPKYLKRVRDSLAGITTEIQRQRVNEIDRLLS